MGSQLKMLCFSSQTIVKNNILNIKPVSIKSLSDCNVIISACNFAMLSLGRLVFLPYQRRQVSNAGLPLQNGETHAVAGDRLAQEASFVTKSADPAGFNTIDVLAWGSVGHLLGFTALV